MTTHVRCGTLFAGDESPVRSDATFGIGDDGKIAFVSATTDAPPVGAQDTVLDYSGLFVMPGLLDVHTHLAYGNAKSEEDIDLYQPMEFRALRGLFFAQKVVAAGYTSICAPGDAGQISLSVRNAINFGLFEGPRVTAAGRYLTTRQGLTDLVSHLDRRPRYLNRPSGYQQGRGNRGNPCPGQERRGLHQAGNGRRADPRRRFPGRRFQPGRNDNDGRGGASPGQARGGACARA
jgi:imidazolonepropionase-like amidohydrolase